MLYLFCPLYAEAKPLIKRLHLKPVASIFGHRCFENDTICLLICGTGILYTSTFAAAVLARAEHLQGMAVYGSSAMLHPLPKEYVYIADQITNTADGRTYYPDVFFQLPIEPVHFVSGEDLYTGQPLPGSLYDMESAGLYAAGSLFLRPDQMLFMRFISDAGNPKTVTAAALRTLSDQHAEQAISYLTAFSAHTADRKEKECPLEETLPISITMRRQALQMLHYARQMHISAYDLTERLNRIKTKEEGKKIIHELYTRISR